MKRLLDYTEEEFKARGYNKYKADKGSYADYVYSKSLYDETGKKYFIDLYYYKSVKLPNGLTLPESYSAKMAFQNSEPYTIIEYDKVGNYSLEELEDLTEKMWKHIGKPYYEKYLIE